MTYFIFIFIFFAALVEHTLLPSQTGSILGTWFLVQEGVLL